MVIGIVVTFLPRLSESLAVDACLDRGGSYDYAQGTCDHVNNHLYVPWSERSHRHTPMLVGMVFILGGMVVLAFGRSRTGRQSS